MERTFKLVVGLQLPPGSKGKYLPEGTEAKESELAGLAVDPLVTSGFLVETTGKFGCPACEADKEATKAAKSKQYTDVLELREHYGKEHPALAAPASIQEV